MPPKPFPLDVLLDAALTAFLRSGFDGTSMDAIATEAGIARRTLFNRFTSKEALFAASIERFWTRMPITGQADGGEAEEDPKQGLLRIARSIVDFWSEPEAVALARLVIAEASRSPNVARTYLEVGKLPALQALIAFLDDLRVRRVMVVPDPDLAARQFVGMLNEPLLWFRVLGADELQSPERRGYVVEEAVRVFLCAYPLLQTVNHASSV